MRMFERRIVHEGLNAFRVVRGYTEEEVATKARLQIAAWSERWQRRQEIALSHQKQIEKRTAWERQSEVDRRRKSLALKRTLESEAAVQAARSILSVALATSLPFDWRGLRDSTVFSRPKPQIPSHNPFPEQPRHDEFRFQPTPVFKIFQKRTVFERIIPAPTKEEGIRRPHTLLLRGGHFVPNSLSGQFPFALGEGEQDIQGQSAHRGGGVELLGDRHEADVMGIKHLDDLGKVGQRAC